MNDTLLPRLVSPVRRLAALATVLALLSGCGGEGGEGGGTTAPFSVLGPAEVPRLVEGDDGLDIALSIRREAGRAGPLTLSIEGASAADVADLSGAPTSWTLSPDAERTLFTLRLDIADAPILPGQRRFVISASDGVHTARTSLTVEVEPVDAPDVYLLIGQSNMVGSSGEGSRQAAPGGPDAPNPRIRQLNVVSNDPFGAFAEDGAYRSPEQNIVAPTLVVAQDPLHVPSPEGDAFVKGSASVGLGLSFAKRALGATSRDIVLVPAAWSGSAFCASENGPRGQWNPVAGGDPALGNTLLFERALLRTNAALAESGGILRGILWHQGESDANGVCAPLYADNLARLAGELRRRIAPDRRGPALRTSDAPIPFVVGTMSRGTDERGDFSEFPPAKQTIDTAHRAVPERVPHAAVSVHDTLIPANGYPCGTQDCIHFGAEALREMGRSYHAALRRALEPR